MLCFGTGCGLACIGRRLSGRAVALPVADRPGRRAMVGAIVFALTMCRS